MNEQLRKLSEENKKLKQKLKERINKTKDFFMLAGLLFLAIIVATIRAFQTYHHSALILTSMICGIFVLLLLILFYRFGPQKEKKETSEVMGLKSAHAYNVTLLCLFLFALIAIVIGFYLKSAQGRLIPTLGGFVMGGLIFTIFYNLSYSADLDGKIYRNRLTEEIKKELKTKNGLPCRLKR